MEYKYEAILNDLSDSLKAGGKLIEIRKDNSSSLWLILVKNDDAVYFGYTVGAANKDFLFDILEFCHENQLDVSVVIN